MWLSYKGRKNCHPEMRVCSGWERYVLGWRGSSLCYEEMYMYFLKIVILFPLDLKAVCALSYSLPSSQQPRYRKDLNVIDRWIDKEYTHRHTDTHTHTHTHTVEYYSVFKKKGRRKLCHLKQCGWTGRIFY